MTPAPVEVVRNTKPAVRGEGRSERGTAVDASDGKESDVGKSALFDGTHAALPRHSLQDASARTVQERCAAETLGPIKRANQNHDRWETLCVDPCCQCW
jgi:hypothetical protein